MDIHADELNAEVAMLEQPGSRRVRQMRGWRIMQDPAGMSFSVITTPSSSLNDCNSWR